MVVVAGIDVSKATLDVSVSEGDVRRFENSATGIRILLRHMNGQGVTKAVCESTGGYERLLVGKLRETATTVQVALRFECAPSHARVAMRQRQTPSTPRCCPAMVWCSSSRKRRNRRWILTVRS